MTATEHHTRFLRAAIAEALRGVRAGFGGPFGAVVVKDDAVIAATCNQVVRKNDPTAHAEIEAIRGACEFLGKFQLDGCDVYASCEPCPMCVGALYWARPRAVYFAATRIDAAEAGFDDAHIYEELGRAPEGRTLSVVRLALPEGIQPFDVWRTLPGRIQY
jgi:guanine deaminase